MIDARRGAPGRPDAVARWLALLAGVVNPVGFVLVYTVAGLARPGYSPVHQAISDLGVGPNGPLLDAAAVVHGLLLVVFAAAFALATRDVLSTGWRALAVVPLTLRGLANVTTAIFTDAPQTVRIHSLATAVALASVLLSFFVVGLALRSLEGWRAWGIYSLTAAGLTLLLIAAMFWAFSPSSPIAPLRLGGLMERAVSAETLAWYVAFGWRLFRGAPDRIAAARVRRSVVT